MRPRRATFLESADNLCGAAAAERMRHEGLWVPAHDVPGHLACGWRFALEEVLASGGTHPDGRVLLLPPAAGAEVAA